MIQAIGDKKRLLSRSTISVPIIAKNFCLRILVVDDAAPWPGEETEVRKEPLPIERTGHISLPQSQAQHVRESFDAVFNPWVSEASKLNDAGLGSEAVAMDQELKDILRLQLQDGAQNLLILYYIAPANAYRRLCLSNASALKNSVLASHNEKDCIEIYIPAFLSRPKLTDKLLY